MKKKTSIWGGFIYIDPASGISLDPKVMTLTFDGNTAHIVGSGKVGKRNVTVTVDAVDNGYPGTNDYVSIVVSNGYSAAGNLVSGDITIH